MDIYVARQPIFNRKKKIYGYELLFRDGISNAFPDIDATQAVCGGEPCVVRTRIPVWLLVRARQLGTSEADLLRCYPTLRAEDLANAWAYYRSHRDEIEQQICENEEA